MKSSSNDVPSNLLLLQIVFTQQQFVHFFFLAVADRELPTNYNSNRKKYIANEKILNKLKHFGQVCWTKSLCCKKQTHLVPLTATFTSATRTLKFWFMKTALPILFFFNSLLWSQSLWKSYHFIFGLLVLWNIKHFNRTIRSYKPNANF